MILADVDGGTRFVTQPDHAALAGALAERWGGEGFAEPTPTPAVRLAVRAHDDGWRPFDRRPRLGPDGTPLDFHEVPAAKWRRLYRNGIDAVARVDRYAGLLVSLHGSGLRRRRYGLSPDWEDTPRAFRGFVVREQRRQRSLATSLRDAAGDDRLSAADVALLDRLHESGEPEDPAEDSRLWRNYRLLEALDALSLRICASPTLDGDPDGTGEGDGTGGSEGDASADRIEVGRVPTAPGEPDATLTAEPVGPGTYAVSPYPFRESPVTRRVPTRTVPDDAYGTDAELLDAFYAATEEELSVTLRPGEP